MVKKPKTLDCSQTVRLTRSSIKKKLLDHKSLTKQESEQSEDGSKLILSIPLADQSKKPQKTTGK